MQATALIATCIRRFGYLSSSQIYVSVFWVLCFLFRVFTINIKITALGSRSSSLWNKQFNASLLIDRDSWILPSTVLARWSCDVMKRTGHKNFNAVSHYPLWPEVLFLNLTWRLQGQISSVLLQLLLSTFSNRKFGRHGKWSVTFWQWENNT